MASLLPRVVMDDAPRGIADAVCTSHAAGWGRVQHRSRWRVSRACAISGIRRDGDARGRASLSVSVQGSQRTINVQVPA